MEDFLNSQKKVLGISDFLKTAENYTKDNFPDFNLDNTFSSAINGKIDTNFLTNTILKLARTRSQTCNSINDNCFDCNYYS